MTTEVKPERAYVFSPSYIRADDILHRDYEFPRHKDKSGVVCWIDSAGRHVYFIQDVRRLDGVERGCTVYLLEGWRINRRDAIYVLDFLESRDASIIELD